MGKNNVNLEKLVMERCGDCAALVEGEAGTWVCDEMGKPCKEVTHCLEGLKLEG